MSSIKSITELKRLKKQKERYFREYASNKALSKRYWETKPYLKRSQYSKPEDKGFEASMLHAESLIYADDFEDNYKSSVN